MNKKHIERFCIAGIFLVAFVLWTVLISFIDVQPIGPLGSSVGFATVNGYFHNLTGVHMSIYTITDWLGLVPIAVMLGFAMLGLVQWIGRRGISKVDYSIFVLGGYYILVFAVYMLFEYVVINRRPILIQGFLEASYPSSTTMLVLCIMPTALMQLYSRMRNRYLKVIVFVLISAFVVFMVVGRFISGVHWFSDIVGGILLSAGLVMLYHATVSLK